MDAREARAEVVLRCDGREVGSWPLPCSGPPDLGVVDELARLQVAARRHGCSIWLRRPSPEVTALLALVGLGDVIRVDPEPG